MYIQSVQDPISHHFIGKTWNGASHQLNADVVLQTSLMDGKIKPAGCFPKKQGNAAYCALFQSNGFLEIKKVDSGVALYLFI